MYAPKSVLLFYISSLILWIYILSEFPSSKFSTQLCPIIPLNDPQVELPNGLVQSLFYLVPQQI